MMIEKATTSLLVELDAGDYAYLRSLAANRGMSVEMVCRSVLRNHIKFEKRCRESQEKLLKAVREMENQDNKEGESS